MSGLVSAAVGVLLVMTSMGAAAEPLPERAY